MRRREFITLLAGAAAWPLCARAQQGKPVIGFLRNASADSSVELIAALRDGLKQTGYVEGQNIAIEYRWPERRDEVPGMAADLVRRPCAVIVAGGNAAIGAAKAATATIPIVFASGDDPVGAGFVTSLSRPGGNITGASFYSSFVLAKQLELLRELLPSATVIGLLVNPSDPTAASWIREAQAAAGPLGQQLHLVNASSRDEIEAAFATLAQLGAHALLVVGSALFTDQRQRVGALALRHGLPAVTPLREFVAADGLMSYGASITDTYWQAGVYAGRILKGEKPADLPIMLPQRFELNINVGTAKALGLDMPLHLQQRADAVIE
jgi:putative tryptophan/tyrosine transport system substrate-binding protein